ncbi:fungal-specific transcription factor domain-containing protein [Abortiporus biennis]|nr:fungal-specific transcription factor domain-containing protein [Abortiporus biennis]
MKEGKKRVKPEGGRGTYVRQACNHCRRRKSKCDGQEPVCGPCRDSGRAAECSWGKETAKKARTQQHFESLVNHIKSLEHKVKELEAELGRGGKQDGLPEAGPSTFPDSLQYPKSEPDENHASHDPSQSGADTDDSDVEQIIAPTKSLVIQGESEFQLYGPTSAFRMAPEEPRTTCNCPEENCVHRSDQALSSLPPNIDWSRHLPRDAPHSREEHDKLVDLFFKFFSPWCMRTIPEYFMRDMHRALSLPPHQKPPKSSHYSPMLHNAVMSVAFSYSDDPYRRQLEFRAKFADKAMSYFEQDCAKPTIPLVMALSLLASFHATKGEQGLGYIFFGMSARVGQALGLGVDCTPWVRSGAIRAQDAMDRYWAYWETFTQDVCWSLYCGRDRCFVTQKDDTTKIPVPYVGGDIDRAPWHCDASKFPLQSNNVASIFKATSDLLRIAERVSDFINGLGKDFRHTNMQLVSELDIELNDWKDSLTPEVDLSASSRPVALPHRLTLHMTYWWLMILLHRPFYRRSKAHLGSEIDHVKLANRAAENIMLISTNWHNNYSIRFCPLTIVQIIFSAGTIFVLSAIQAISGPRLGRVTLATSLQQIQQCIDYMAIIGETWESANSVKDILLNILDKQLKPRLQLRQGEAALKATIIPNAPSPKDDSDSPRSSPSLRSSASPHGSPMQFPDAIFGSEWSSQPGMLPSNIHHPHSSSGSGTPPSMHNPYITQNPIFPPHTHLLDADTDINMSMNFTGIPMEFVMPMDTMMGPPQASNVPSNQYMGMPSIGSAMGYQPSGPSGSGGPTVEFSAEEMAIMEDIFKKQQHQQQQQQQNHMMGQPLIHSLARV